MIILRVPLSLRETVYCEGVSRGEEEEFDEIKRLVKSEVHPEERNRLVTALGCSRDPNALRRRRFKTSAFLKCMFQITAKHLESHDFHR